jgi:hypothetical protein
MPPPVTVDAGAIVGGGSGVTGWSARSTFAINDVDQYQPLHDSNYQSIEINAATGRQAQSFTAGSNYNLAAVVVYLQRTGTPTDNINCEIQTNSGSSPSGSVVGTATAMAGTHIVAAIPHTCRFVFPTPPSLTSGTKYWIVLSRSGADDAVNFIGWSIETSASYAGGGAATEQTGVWSGEHATFDYNFATLKTTQSLYQVTQDTKLHVWKSSDNGAAWAELDSAGAPTVNSSTKPFDCDHHWEYRSVLAGGPNSLLYCGYFTNTNTVRVRGFDPFAGTWITADLGGADWSTDVDFNRNIRVTATAWEVTLHYTSVADDADLEFVIYDGAMSAQQVMTAVTSADSSTISDAVKDRTSTVDNGGTRFVSTFHHEANLDDYFVETNFGTTQGTALALDTAAADIEAEHGSAVYQPYAGSGGVHTVIAAYIDADGSIEERTAQLEVTSASITLGTQHAVGTATTSLGRSLATCKYANDLYIFAGLSGGIDVYKDPLASGTWNAVVNWKTGLTAAVLSTALPVEGKGILVSYVDNGNVVVDWFNPSLVAERPPAIKLRPKTLKRR